MFKAFIAILSLSFVVSASHAEETVGEKIKDGGNSIVRGAKKGGNRLKEATCTDGDLKCGAKKGKHRVEEAGSSVKDGAKDLKEKVD